MSWLPPFASLLPYTLKKDHSSLELFNSDSLIVFVSRSCPDSLRLRTWLSEKGYGTKRTWSSVAFVQAADGVLLTSSFNLTDNKYPNFSVPVYEQFCEGINVLPKVYKVSVGGKVSGAFHAHHHTGLQLDELIVHPL